MGKIMKKCTLLFFLYGFIIFAMDGEKKNLRLLKENGHQPKITKSIFNSQDYCARRIPLSAVMPKSLMITPDKKGVVMGRKKEVLLFTFLNAKTLLSNVSCQTIITHSDASHCPMIAVRKPEIDPLIVVSAINCKSREVGRHISEFIRYSDGLCKVKKLNIPTQAIALDETGKILVVAGDKKVAAIDFAKDKEHQITFSELKDGEFFVDIAVNLEKAISILAVNNNGEVWSLKLENLNDFFKLSRISSIKTGDAIQKMSYAATESLLYLTRDNEVKSIDAYGLLGEKAKKIHVFSCPKSCSTVFFDRDSTVVYWSCNKINDSCVYQIQVCVQKEGQCQKQFILEASVGQEMHTHIKDGKINVGQDYIALIAVYDDLVTALSKYGVFYKWELNEYNELISSDGADQSQKKSRQPRRRSKSLSGEYSEALQQKFKSLEGVAEQMAESTLGDISPEDFIFRSNSVPNTTKRKKEQTKSLPGPDSKINRKRSVSTAPAATPKLLPTTSDQKVQKTSPRVKALISSASPRPSRESSPRPKSRPNSTSPRSRSSSIVDIKKDEDQD
jgi:hypothetical protein